MTTDNHFQARTHLSQALDILTAARETFETTCPGEHATIALRRVETKLTEAAELLRHDPARETR